MSGVEVGVDESDWLQVAIVGFQRSLTDDGPCFRQTMWRAVGRPHATAKDDANSGPGVPAYSFACPCDAGIQLDICILVSVSLLLLVEASAGAVGCGNGCRYVRVPRFAVEAAHARAGPPWRPRTGGTLLGPGPAQEGS